MLTATERDCLIVICDALSAAGVAPTLAEICTSMDWASRSTAARVLGQLEAKCFIRREAHKPRAILVLKPVPGGDLEKAQRRLALAESRLAELLDAVESGIPDVIAHQCRSARLFLGREIAAGRA